MSDESERVQVGAMLRERTAKSLDRCRAEKRRLRARLVEARAENERLRKGLAYYQNRYPGMPEGDVARTVLAGEADTA